VPETPLSAVEVERYLHAHIPLSTAMQVRVLEVLAERVIVGAPLAPNINHRETVFGGSASAVAILAAWALLQTRMAREGIACRLVIQRNSMTYLLPINAAFTATASIGDDGRWPRFLETLRRRGRARVGVGVLLHSAEQLVGEFEGDFVAIGADD
jgi:thioesterase domain-containing protein